MESEKTVRPVFLREERFISNGDFILRVALIPLLLPCWTIFKIVDKVVEEIQNKERL